MKSSEAPVCRCMWWTKEEPKNEELDPFFYNCYDIVTGPGGGLKSGCCVLCAKHEVIERKLNESD